MMSVVWDCSSDIVAISVKGWNGNVTTMLSPKCLRYDGIKLDSLSMVIVVRDISDRFKRFEAEKQAVLELTGELHFLHSLLFLLLTVDVS